GSRINRVIGRGEVWVLLLCDAVCHLTSNVYICEYDSRIDTIPPICADCPRQPLIHARPAPRYSRRFVLYCGALSCRFLRSPEACCWPAWHGGWPAAPKPPATPPLRGRPPPMRPPAPIHWPRPAGS